MSRPAALRDLARRLGIGAEFWDALGEHHLVSDDTLAALVAAFGLPDNPAAAMQALDDWDLAAPLGLAPAQFVGAEDPQPKLPLRLDAAAGPVDWHCRLETGEERAGRSEAGVPALALPGGLPLGYHRLAVSAAGTQAEIDLIVAPAACHLPPALGLDRRAWGLSCQLYGLRSAHDLGLGDFTDLVRLAQAAGASGAATLGVNPLHALFLAEPHHTSPYSPSSRLWLDPLYIDPRAIPGFAENAEVGSILAEPWFAATLAAARAGDIIDYGAVAACQRRLLEALFQSRPDTVAFGEFQRRGGQGLSDFATFEVLHEHFRNSGQGFSWHDWPAAMRDPRSPEVAAFAAAHRDRIEFFQFLQFEADRQLAAAAAAGRAAGLDIGIYRDLGVGANPHGAEAWTDPIALAPGATIGAPPDGLARAGQNWGLAPVNPLALRRQGLVPFVAILRANMRHAGLLRIDHVMSLDRLYWIPAGMPARAGAYVDYPFEELLRVVALESVRQSCAVIGEDLGTVPEGFRDRMQAANVLSYRVLRFERGHDSGYVRPADYPPLAAAVAATHDMATIKGFWLGCDLDWRRRLGLYPDPDAEAADAADRDRDRRLLLDALVGEGLLPQQRTDEFLPAAFTPELAELMLAYLARSRSRLMLVQVEDIAGEAEQANLPGTNDEHPNWRRRLSRDLEDLVASPEWRRIAALLNAERRR